MALHSRTWRSLQSQTHNFRYRIRPNSHAFSPPRQVLKPQIPRRHASTTSAAPVSNPIINFFYGTTLVLGLGILYVYATDTRASLHRYVTVPLLRTIYPDPERAHEVGNASLAGLYAFGLHPRERGDPDKSGDLAVEVFGQTLRNPVGTSAGIDKHADIPDPLFALGPSIIEIGGVTPHPQPGNEKPRVFRVSSQNAMINRYGLNSEGADHIAERLRHRVRLFAEKLGLGHDVHAETAVLDGEANVPPGSLLPGKLLAVNIAKNKTTPENDIEAVTKDYLYCAERLAPYVDILVVNVSSPNTPGLRSLQNQESLTKILSEVVKAARSVQRTTKPAVMVKVSPDEDSEEQIVGICQAVWESDVDGVIVGNTTNSRPTGPMKGLPPLTPLEEQALLEQGGFSGPHLFGKTVKMVQKYKKLLGDRAPPKEVEIRAPQRSSGAVDKLVDETKTKFQTPDGSDSVRAEGKEAKVDQIRDSVNTKKIPAKNIPNKPDKEKQNLIQLPKEKFYDQKKEDQDKLVSRPVERGSESNKDKGKQTKTTMTPPPPPPPPPGAKQETGRRDQPKVIFATGGITNGQQALEVLNAGASVAMVYTALVYGGAGTISRIKDEIRQEIKTQQKERKSKITSKES